MLDGCTPPPPLLKYLRTAAGRAATAASIFAAVAVGVLSRSVATLVASRRHPPQFTPLGVYSCIVASTEPSGAPRAAKTPAFHCCPREPDMPALGVVTTATRAAGHSARIAAIHALHMAPYAAPSAKAAT